MTKVKIEPSSANGFNVELYSWDGKKYQLSGILEMHTDGERLYIIRREKNFKDFTVSTTLYKKGENPHEVEIAKTHSITIEV